MRRRQILIGGVAAISAALAFGQIFWLTLSNVPNDHTTHKVTESSSSPSDVVAKKIEIASVPLVGHGDKPSDDTSETPFADLINPVDDRSQAAVSNAFDVAQSALESVEANRYIRWEPVLLAPDAIFDDPKNVAAGRTPEPKLRVLLFGNREYIAELENFNDMGWGASWYGRLVAGGSGTLTVYTVPDDRGQPVALVHIASDQGNFSIFNAHGSPIYIAIEINPNIVDGAY